MISEQIINKHLYIIRPEKSSFVTIEIENIFVMLKFLWKGHATANAQTAQKLKSNSKMHKNGTCFVGADAHIRPLFRLNCRSGGTMWASSPT